MGSRDELRYKRVLLKLSGEALGGTEGSGIDVNTVRGFAANIAEVARMGVEVAIVCGGGNILRGAEFSELGADRANSDYMGMLATVINALALCDAIEQAGVPARVHTALEIQSVAEPFVRKRAINQLEKGHVVLLAAGTGNPYFSTDTAAALRANELGCEILLKATKVDGVYDSDPKLNSDAKRYSSLSYMDVLSQGLRVMDGTAITLCMENQLPILVFDLFGEGNLKKVVCGEEIGSLIRGSD
ncbi:MAG: UMP kinase [Planctomycetota bacterium]|jgi:uridylate kinase|nr:UMP kinase [Planctomycetota bacterium]